MLMRRSPDGRPRSTRRLSLTARGLLSYLVEQADPWSVTTGKLCRITSDDKDTVYAALRELADGGWLENALP